MADYSETNENSLAARMATSLFILLRLVVLRELGACEGERGWLPGEIPVKGEHIEIRQQGDGFVVSLKLGVNEPEIEALAEEGVCLSGDYFPAPDDPISSRECLLSRWRKTSEGYVINWARDCRGGDGVLPF